MTYKFDEWFLQCLSIWTCGHYNVHQWPERERNSNAYYLKNLKQRVLVSESWKALIPDRCQQLLDTWMSHKL